MTPPPPPLSGDSAARILLTLWDAQGRDVPMGELLRIVGGPHAAAASVQTALDDLTRRGNRIERSPAGVRLVTAGLGSWEDLISVMARRQGWRLGRRAQIFSQTTSTNDAAFVAAAGHDSDGTVVLANFQTAGRGRLGHTWQAQAGQSVLLSIVLRDMRPEALDRLTLLAGLATAVGIERAVAEAQGAPPRLDIKWPNDLLVAGATGQPRKVAGILVEARRLSGPMGKADVVVVGIGINVCQGAGDLPADLAGRTASLFEVTGLMLDRLRVILAVLESLDRHLRMQRDDEWLGAWKERCGMLGRHMTFRAGEHTYAGQVLDVAPMQGLMIRDDHGATHFLSARTCSIG